MSLPYRNSRERSRRQRELRRRRGERAFLFDKDVARCLGEVAREEWEDILRLSGGEVAEAAAICGIQGVPRSAKALWGLSAEEAAATWRRWRNKRGKG